MESALKSLYKSHSKPSDFIPEELFKGILDTLNSAVSGDFAEQYPQLCEMIKDNNEVFAAFKVHDQCTRMVDLLTDESGNIKSFAQWRKEAEPIANHHNKVWLRTEYDTAVKRAKQAQQWKQFEDERDVLPNLRWVPSTAATPGADHMIFWDTVLPIDHPFWSSHKPGDRWGCQCSIEATDDPETDAPRGSINDEPAPGLDNNPAQDGKLFSDSHPYFPDSCNTCPFNTGGGVMSTPKNKARDCASCPYIHQIIATDKTIKKTLREYNEFGNEWRRDIFDEKTGGYLVTHSDRIGKANKSKNEKAKFTKEHAMSANLARAGFRIKLLSEGSTSSSCDITVNGILSDLKKTKSASNVRSYANDTFGNKQGKIVVFELENRSTALTGAIKGIELKKGQKIIYYYSDKPNEVYVIEK